MPAKHTLIMLFALALLLVNLARGQDTDYIYQSEDGTALTQDQVDSLAAVHNDQLEYSYTREDGKTVVVVGVPDGVAEDAASATQTFSSSADSAGSSAARKRTITYVDTQENEISKEAFLELIKELGVTSQYSVTQEDGISKVVMRPATGENARELREKVDAQRARLETFKGKPFPFESMKDLEGTSYDSNFLRGKVVVLNYWYVECAPCIREMPSLNELREDYARRDDIVFLAPSLSDKQQINTMLEERAFNYTLIPDAGAHAQEVGIYGYPTNIVVDKQGTLSFLEVGYHDDTVSKMRTQIDALLDE